MSWNTLSARDKSAFMNVALRHGVTDLAAIKRAYDSLGGDNVMAGGGPAKTKEPPISLAQRAAENRLRRANLFDDGGDVGDDFESRLAKINAADAVKMRTMRNIEALYDSSLPDAYSARELIKDKDSGNMYYPSELFLLDPDKQLTMMEGLGFIPGEPHDYGTVTAKVARSSNPDMPVYQRYPHDITRDEITPIGRGYRGETFDNVNRPRVFQVDNGWLIGPDGHPVRLDDPKVNRAITKTLGADDWTDTKGLIDAGDYPFVLYRDDSGNFYVNAWDVNNYSDPMSPRFQNYNWWQKAGAKMLDRMGNPFVQTLGYKSLPLDDYGYAERGSGYILPNVTVTPKKKAHGGRLNLFDDGGQEDVIDWGNVDLKAMRDAYQQSQEDGVRTYTAVPASRMSYNERLRLWRNDDTGKWYPQDALIFPGGKLDGVTVVHNRNTNRDFVVPSDEYVRPLNTQDYFDHTGSNALEFASLMTSPTNLFMPSHVAGAIWDTRDKLSGKNPDVNLWDSWLHENRGIGRTGNPYLDAGLNLAGDVLGYSLPGALKSAGRATTNAVKRNFAKHMFMERAPFGYKGMVQAMKDIPRSMIHDAVRLHNPNYEEMLRRRKWYMDPQLQTAVDPYDVPLKKAMDARSDAYSMWLGLGPGNNTYVPHPTIPGVYYSPGDIATMPINMWKYMYGIAPLGKDFKALFGRAFKDPFELLDGKPHHGIDNVNSSLGNLTVSFEPVGDKVVDEIGGKTNRYIMKQVDSWDVQPFIRATDHPSRRIERYLNKKGSPLAGTIKNPFANVGKPLIDLSKTISHATRPLAKTHPELRRRIRRVNDKLRENGVRLNSTLDPNTWKRKTYNWLDNKFNDFELSVLTGGSPFNVVNEVPMMVYLPKHGPAEYMRGWLHAAQTPESLPEELQTFMREHPYMDFDAIPRSYREMGYAHGGRLNKFDGLDNLGKPNQLVTAFDDLVAARDRYAQTGDIGTSWEPVNLNDVSITDNGFITREGRVGDSFVLPEATMIGQRPVMNEAILEEKPDDNSFLGRLRAARNRVKYGHSTLTEEDKAMTRYANKIAAAGSAAIATGVAAPYFAPYLASNVGTVLNAMQPSTYLDALASSLGAQVGNYGLGARTLAGALGNTVMASGFTAEGLDYLYNTYLNGNNPRSFGEDLNASLALVPFLAAPAAGAKKLIDLSRNSGRLMTRLEHANRLTRYLSAPRRLRRYRADYEEAISEAKKKADNALEKVYDANHVLFKFSNIYGHEDSWVTKRAPQIDVSKASKENILKYLRKHNLPENLFEFNEAGEPLVAVSGVPVFESGSIEVPVFGEGKTKTFNITDVSSATKKNLRTDAITKINNKSYNASELADYYKLTRDNIKYVEEKTGGKVFGSSAMVGFEGVPHATRDYDVLVTQEMADKKMPGWRNNFNDGLTHYQLDESKYGNVGNIDVNVIEQGPDGKATGTRAMELFRQFFPEEYGKQAEATMLKGLDEKAMKITKTPQELLDAYDPVTKTVMDALEIDYKQTRKDKHATRILGYLAYSQNPKSVAKGINNFAKMLVGKDYRPAPKLNFSDREANIKFIDTLFGAAADSLHRIADSPERMQNLFDMFYLGETTYVRELKTLQVPKVQRDMALNLWPNQDGVANGKLVNTVKGGRSNVYHQAINNVVVSQIPVELKDGMSIADAWKKISRTAGYRHYKFTKEDLAADSRLGKYLGINEGDEAFDVLKKISDMPNNPITDADNVLRDPKRFQDILHNPFYPEDEWPSDQRTRIAGEILKDNGILGLEGTHYLNGAYLSVVENLPYVSRQNLYWPGENSFKGLRERAGDIRMINTNPAIVTPMYVPGHNGKYRDIKAGIASMSNESIKVPIASKMSKSREMLRHKYDAASAKYKAAYKVQEKQEDRLHFGTPLLKGKSLDNLHYGFEYKKYRAEERAKIAAIVTSVASLIGGTGYIATKEDKAERKAVYDQALRNLYGEDYYKNFSEENPGADNNRFVNEHKDEIDAEVTRLMRERRNAKRKKKQDKK